MTAAEVLSRFRSTISDIGSDMRAEASDPAPDAETAEVEESGAAEAPAPSPNGAVTWQIGKVGMTNGGRLKTPFTRSDGVLVLVYAPEADQLTEIAALLGVDA